MGTVVGLFETRDEAVAAVEALKEAGFAAGDMSSVMRDRGEAAEVAVDAGVADASGDAAAKGALGGGLLGGFAGLVLGAGALAIPGIGPIIAAGPIVAMLTGGALGAATGGILGVLTEAGVPDDETEHYRAGVERGGILLSARVPDGREAEARRPGGRRPPRPGTPGSRLRNPSSERVDRHQFRPPFEEGEHRNGHQQAHR